MGLTKIAALLTLVIELVKDIGAILRLVKKEEQHETQETGTPGIEKDVQQDSGQNAS